MSILQSLGRGRALDGGADPDPLPHQLHDNRQRYDLGAAMRRAYRAWEARGRPPQELQLDGFEAEVSAEIARRSQATPKGFYLPLDLPARTLGRGPELRTAGLVNATAGAGSVPTILPKLDLVDVLRARTVCGRLGARMMTIPVGVLSLPRKTQAAAVSWVGEGVAASATNLTADSVPFAPHTVTGWTGLSRQYLRATWAGGDDTAAEDLLASVAVEADRAALNGIGSAGQPTGILAMSGVPTVALATNGRALTYADLVGLEEALSLANADSAVSAAVGLATTPNVRAALRQLPKIGTSYGVAWEGGRVLDYPACASANMPSNLTKGTGTALSSLIYANWDDVCLLTWGAADVLINPYAYSSTGTIIVRVYLDLDVQLRHNASALKITDIVAA